MKDWSNKILGDCAKWLSGGTLRDTLLPKLLSGELSVSDLQN